MFHRTNITKEECQKIGGAWTDKDGCFVPAAAQISQTEQLVGQILLYIILGIIALIVTGVVLAVLEILTWMTVVIAGFCLLATVLTIDLVRKRLNLDRV